MVRAERRPAASPPSSVAAVAVSASASARALLSVLLALAAWAVVVTHCEAQSCEGGVGEATASSSSSSSPAFAATTCTAQQGSDGGSTSAAGGDGAVSPLLIRGGTVVNADRQWRADVLVEGGVIAAIGLDLEVPKGARVIDATGRYVMPGGIDPHTHLAMPFMGTESCDDFYSGQAAALTGGTTMHIDFVLPDKGGVGAGAAGTATAGEGVARGYEAWVEKARRNAVMDYGFHMAVTQWDDSMEAAMRAMVEKGINSFKFFLAYKGALQVTDEELIHGFEACKKLGALPQVHCENGDAVAWGQKRIFEMGITGPEGHPLSRPAEVEGEATRRAITLAGMVGVPLYVVHVMSKNALDEVAKARKNGQQVVGEPVVSGLALDESELWHADFDHAARYVMSPPIRSKEHQTALRNALATNTLQIVATDHCPFNSSQKARGREDFRLIPNGVNGIGERMHITWDVMVNSGLMSPSDYVRVTSTECARVFNLYPRKGVIAEGSDADIIVLNPNRTTVISAKTHHSRIDTNVYEGWTMQGNIETTISRGRVVWEDGSLSVTRGSGRYVPRKPFGPLFDGLPRLDAVRRAAFSAPVQRQGVARVTTD